MSPEDVAFVKGVIAFLLVAGTGMSAYWLRVRARHLRASGRDDALDMARDEIAHLRAEVEARMLELDERMDFVERRLVQEGEKPRLPAASRVPTPV
jgi:hypothetical protein